MLGEVIVEIRHELVERNRKAGRAIERCHIRDVALDQHRARIAQLLQNRFDNPPDLVIKTFPEMTARHADAQPVETRRRDLRADRR